jgi:hypothetical protein
LARTVVGGATDREAPAVSPNFGVIAHVAANEYVGKSVLGKPKVDAFVTPTSPTCPVTEMSSSIYLA